MKISAIAALFMAALGLSALAAENAQKPSAPASDGQTGVAAIRKAANANQYLFAFFYEKEDEGTRAARQAFDSAMKNMKPAPQVIAVDRTAANEKEIVEKFRIDRAPMPMVLAIAPNGAVTGGIKGADVTEARLQDAVVSPAMQQCIKSMQERRLLLVCLQNSSTRDNDAAMKGVNEFKADARFAEATDVVKVDPGDAKESKLLAQLKADPKAKVANTTFLAPPGVVVARIDGATSKDTLVNSLTKAMSSCGSGCDPSGCAPAPGK